MENILIIGFGDIAVRLIQNFSKKDDYNFYSVSRSSKSLDNLNHIEWDWLSGKKLILPEITFSNIIFIPKPSAYTEEGYKDGFQTSLTNITNSLSNVNFECFMGISSTSVYGKQQFGLLTEEIEPKPDNFRGEIILKYEQRIESEIDAHTNILRFAGLYDPKEKTPEFHNKLSRNTASNIIDHFIHSKKSGLFNCLEDNALISNGRNIINDKLKNSGFNFLYD